MRAEDEMDVGGLGRVLVTRSRAGASRLRGALEARGVEVIELPLLRAEAVGAEQVAARAVQASDLVVTSARGAARLAEALAAEGALRRWPPERVWVVGPVTLRAVAEAGLIDGPAEEVRLPERFVAEDLASLWAGCSLRGRRFLFPRGAHVRPVVEASLRVAGAELDACVLYRTYCPPEAAETLLQLARTTGTPELVTLASSRTVSLWVELLDVLDAEERARWAGLPVLSIGPITSEAVRARGLRLVAEAEEASVESLADAARAFLAVERAGEKGR